MKVFFLPTESDGQDRKPERRGGLALMLALYSNPKWLSVGRGAVERLTKTLGFPEGQCRSITRAVDEVLSNMARHSYGNQLDQPIAGCFQRTHRQSEGEFRQGL